MTTFVTRIHELLSSRNVLKKNLCHTLNISIMTFYRYEQGEREPSMSTLIALADFFNVSIDYLVGRSDDPERR